MSIILPDDIRQLQRQIQSYADGLNVAALASAQVVANGAEFQEWSAFYATCVAYYTTDVGITNTTGTLFDEGVALKHTLDEWRDRFAKEGATVPPKQGDPQGQGPANMLESATKFVAVAVAGYLLVQLFSRKR